MKNTNEICDIVSCSRVTEAHIHTYLCDGASDMTVANIVRRSEELGIDTVILTPHFHRRVSDASATLYDNSEESIFSVLREEIKTYEAKGGRVRVLLSAEADIVSPDGELALPVSREALDALDFVTPTMNYHPLLPLEFVRLTYGKEINGLHESGAYAAAARAAGGVEYLLQTMYDTQIRAILGCPYPVMLGHFFAAHSVHPDRYTWFGAREEHLPLMTEGADRVVAACQAKGAILDLTGVHLREGETAGERMEKNGFLVDWQRFVIRRCVEKGVRFVVGSDAHRLAKIGYSRRYYDALIGQSDCGKNNL